MMRDGVRQLLEPEVGQLVEDLALAGNPGREDMIVGRDAIARDDQQQVVQVVEIPYLAAAGRRKAGQFCLPDKVQSVVLLYQRR